MLRSEVSCWSISIPYWWTVEVSRVNIKASIIQSWQAVPDLEEKITLIFLLSCYGRHLQFKQVLQMLRKGASSSTVLHCLSGAHYT